MQSELVEVQVKVTHLENLVAELNEVVTRQSEEVSALTRRLVQVETQLRASIDRELGDEPPPPHY